MNLSIFVIVPLLMLLGLWLARNDKQVRGVMVAGASVLLGLSIYLVFAFLEARETMPADQAPMLFTYCVPWFEPLSHQLFTRCGWYLSGDASPDFYHRVHRYICFLADGANEEGILPLVHTPEHRCIWLLHLNRHVHHVHVL